MHGFKWVHILFIQSSIHEEPTGAWASGDGGVPIKPTEDCEGLLMCFSLLREQLGCRSRGLLQCCFRCLKRYIPDTQLYSYCNIWMCVHTCAGPYTSVCTCTYVLTSGRLYVEVRRHRIVAVGGLKPKPSTEKLTPQTK